MHALVAVWLLFTLMLLASSRAVPAGTDVRTLKDPIGTELYAAAQSPEGQIAEVGPYLFSKPGTTTPVGCESQLRCEVGDLACGVGYYKIARLACGLDLP